MTEKFSKGFNEMKSAFERAENILLVAHSRPDGDTIGSVLALQEYLGKNLKKKSDIVCQDPLPEYISNIIGEESVLTPENISLESYDLLVGCDAVGRSFEKITSGRKESQKTIIIDHHPLVDIEGINANVIVANEKYSSVCEILYDYFYFHRIDINKKMATCLLMGILYDTGAFQHANTNARVMEISADLMRKGAPMNKIIEATMKNKKLETLKLWGRAMERAQINEKTGAILSFVTTEDIKELGVEEDGIGRIAELLNTVTGTKFSLVLLEKDKNKLRGSLRSEWYKNVDVSEIARMFRGGGHKLASGFEIVGKIVKGEKGIEVE
jgi:phosphoesterase RecJ-like protein